MTDPFPWLAPGRHVTHIHAGGTYRITALTTEGPTRATLVQLTDEETGEGGWAQPWQLEPLPPLATT